MANNLSFPGGIGTNVVSGQPFMLLTSYESKNAIESNSAIVKSSIALYIPPNALKTGFKAEYTGTEGAAMKAGMVSSIGRTNMNNILETVVAGFKGAGLAAGGKIAAQADKGTGMLAAQGIAVNNHMALTYKGPSQFRTHEFTFNFFPRKVKDAEVIQEILKDFENGMLPRLGGGGVQMIKERKLSAPFFQAPRHWTIDFFKTDGTKNVNLFEIKKSVITDMTINHDPNSTVSLHADGMPVQTTLGLTFQEIELPVSLDKGNVRTEGDFSTQMQKAKDKQASQTINRSDYRLKDNITLLQEEGVETPNIYSFNYKWDSEVTWIGVMAQELLDTGYSDAVGMDSEGFYNVNYSKLGFPMIGFK